MGFLDALLGRTRPVRPDLDALFALPSAAVTLEAATGLRPTGAGAVCFKGAEGGAFARMLGEAQALSGPVRETRDAFGYTWLLRSGAPDDLSALVTDLHAVNSELEAGGFGPSLLCSLLAFAGTVEGTPRRLALVYLYKRGTFYPFAPTGPERRDTAFELQVRSAIGADLPFEADLARWFPVWGAPGV